MTGLGNLIIKNCKLFFKDKGMFFTSLITPLILLVLYDQHQRACDGGHGPHGRAGGEAARQHQHQADGVEQDDQQAENAAGVQQRGLFLGFVFHE